MPGQRQSGPFLALLLLSLIWTNAPYCAQYNAAKSASPSSEINAVGCIGNDGYFFTDSGEYTLVGNDDELAEHGGDWVRIRGKRVPQTEDGPPNLEVLGISVVSKSRSAILDPTLHNTARGHTYSNEPVGMRISLPRQFNPVDEDRSNYPLTPGFIKNDHVTHVLNYEIPRETYLPQPYRGIERTLLQKQNPPHTNFVGGAFAVFVNPEITDAASCKKFDPQNAGDISSRTINGFDYTVLSTISGPAETFDFFHIFQNGRCFEVNFDLEFARSGGDDITCAIDYADDEALEKSLLSKISFFQPKTAAAATAR